MSTEAKKLKRATFSKNEKTKIIASFSEYNKKMYLNVRQHVMNKQGEIVPTPAGFNIEDTEESLQNAKVFFEKIVRLIDQRLDAS